MSERRTKSIENNLREEKFSNEIAENDKPIRRLTPQLVRAP